MLLVDDKSLKVVRNTFLKTLGDDTGNLIINIVTIMYEDRCNRLLIPY